MKNENATILDLRFYVGRESLQLQFNKPGTAQVGAISKAQK